MHIVLLCATRRGYCFAQTLFEIAQGNRFSVFSFRETPWEPAYFDAIQQLTLENGHEFHESRNVAHAKWDGFWRDNAVDLMLMVSWRYLVPKQVYARACLGTFVLHDSLLPKYRGFAPTVWAMINGESETGVTLFRAADDVDAGDIIDQVPISIGANETIADIVQNVTVSYLTVIKRNIASLLAGNAQGQPQDHVNATYTCKWTPDDGIIRWDLRSQQIYNLIRGTCRPYPGAFTYLDNSKLTIWSAELTSPSRRYVSRIPGRVVDIIPGKGSTVLTGDGSITLKEVQLEGETPVNASVLLNSPSQTLGDAPS